ncbi:MAG: hypothetical protein CO093_10125 [Alphaproteobacteria bacterium CG_4_9_14_3_um_filter_47_13]|nr:MAG: hypothetical protein CO093_10125 [Alphaproteobacteria bacterium CG_4_9_14_3_um_filter_47_13]
MKAIEQVAEAYQSIKIAQSWEEVMNLPFEKRGLEEDLNLIVYPRSLTCDFNALSFLLYTKLQPVASFMGAEERREYIEDILRTEVSNGDPRFALQADYVLSDMGNYKKAGLKSNLRNIDHLTYQGRVTTYGHVDKKSMEAIKSERFIINYIDPGTEFILNEDSVLVKDFSCGFLKRDVYVVKEGREALSGAVGHVFKMACLDNDAGVSPVIHRAPALPKGAPPRLMLIGNR